MTNIVTAPAQCCEFFTSGKDYEALTEIATDTGRGMRVVDTANEFIVIDDFGEARICYYRGDAENLRGGDWIVVADASEGGS